VIGADAKQTVRFTGRTMFLTTTISRREGVALCMLRGMVGESGPQIKQVFLRA
jgi:hypothetical protein